MAALEEDPPDVVLGKKLKDLLRHHATKVGVPITDDGWVKLDVVLRYINLLSHDGTEYTEDDVRRIVESNDKKRFELRESDEEGTSIRAVQGHTMQSVGTSSELLGSALTIERAPVCYLRNTAHRLSQASDKVSRSCVKQVARAH